MKCSKMDLDSSKTGKTEAKLSTVTEVSQVYEEKCVICDETCYVRLPSAPNCSVVSRAVQIRKVIYEAFGIQVDPSFFYEFQEGLPLCPPCYFNVGGLKNTQKQLNELQYEYDRIRSEMAFSIMKIVDRKKELKRNKTSFGSKSPTRLLNSFRKSEIETLHQLVYEGFHGQAGNTDETFDFHIPIRTGEPKQYKNKKLPSPPPQSDFQKGAATANVITSPLMLTNKGQVPKRNWMISKNNFDEKVQLTPDNADPTPNRRMENLTSVGAISNGVKNRRTKDVQIESQGPSQLDMSINSRNVSKQVENFEGKLPSDFQGETITLSMSPKLFQKGGYSSTEYTNEEESANGMKFPEHATGTEGFEDDSFEEDVDEGSLHKFSPSLEITEYNGTVHFLDESLSEKPKNDAVSGKTKDDNCDILSEPTSPHRAYSGLVDALEIQQNKRGLYECMFCGKTFIHKYPYRDHLKTHTGEGPRCDICDKIFPKNHNLMLHMRTHTGEKPYVCTVCKKGFADKSNLKVHMRVHTGERPYKCEFCDQGFVNSSRLIVHKRLHTGEKPFPCDYCSRSFATSNQLSSHVKNHFNENKPFKCVECGRGYTNATSLQAHINVHHVG